MQIFYECFWPWAPTVTNCIEIFNSRVMLECRSSALNLCYELGILGSKGIDMVYE